MLDIAQQEKNLQQLWDRRDYHEYFVELCDYPASHACRLLRPNLLTTLNLDQPLNNAQKAALIEGVFDLRDRALVQTYAFPDQKRAVGFLDVAIEELMAREDFTSDVHGEPEIEHPGFRLEKHVPKFVAHHLGHLARCLDSLVHV